MKHGTKGKVIGGILGGAAGAIVAKNTGTEVELPAGVPLVITLDDGFMVARTHLKMPANRFLVVPAVLVPRDFLRSELRTSEVK